MAEPTPEYQPIDVDERGRVSLARLRPKPGHYLGEVQSDGTVVLHPAVVQPEAQAWLDSRPDLQRLIREANERPEQLIRRGRPRRRPAAEA